MDTGLEAPETVLFLLQKIFLTEKGVLLFLIYTTTVFHLKCYYYYVLHKDGFSNVLN